jgi:hypothetical protein
MKQRFYHASPKKFRHGDILRGSCEGGAGYAHDNVCMTTEPKPHGTIASNIPRWSGWRGNWQPELVAGPDWYVYEVEPLTDPGYVAGNCEYQTKFARVLKNLGLAKNFLQSQKSIGKALPLDREKRRRDTQQKRQQRREIESEGIIKTMKLTLEQLRKEIRSALNERFDTPTGKLRPARGGKKQFNTSFVPDENEELTVWEAEKRYPGSIDAWCEVAGEIAPELSDDSFVIKKRSVFFREGDKLVVALERDPQVELATYNPETQDWYEK